MVCYDLDEIETGLDIIRALIEKRFNNLLAEGLTAR